MTRHNEWTFGPGKQLRGAGNSRGRRLGYARGAEVLDGTDRGRWAIQRLAQLHVLGDVDQHRAGAPAARYAEGLMHDVCYVFDSLHEKVVFRDRLRHAQYVGFLEGIAANEVTRYLPGDRHNGRRVHVGRGEAGDEVGGARATGGDAYTDLARSAGIAIGGVSGRLLMPHQDMAQSR